VLPAIVALPTGIIRQGYLRLGPSTGTPFGIIRQGVFLAF
jgi:hypothetical protein